MNLLSMVLALSTMLVLSAKAVVFFEATVCRQDAWLSVVELKTHSLLETSSARATYLSRCRVRVTDQGWSTLTELRSHAVALGPLEKI